MAMALSFKKIEMIHILNIFNEEFLTYKPIT